ncbi:MAG: glycoside hydrolase family 16 protein [Planctomycetota bacterium]
MKSHSKLAADRRICGLLLCLVFPSFVVGEQLPLKNHRPQNTLASLTVSGGLLVKSSANSKGYPGVSVLPNAGEFFDFSKHGRIEAVVRNVGDVDVPVTLRVDNRGNSKDQPFSAESTRLAPGEASAIVVFFGRRFGWKKSFPINPAKVNQLLFFTEGSTKPRQFLVESVVAVGDPGQTPEKWHVGNRVAPKDGIVFGPANPLVSNKQLNSTGGARWTFASNSDRIQIDFTNVSQALMIQPLGDAWNLREATQIRVEFSNIGIGPARPGVRVESGRGSTRISTTPKPIAPGETASVVVPFAATVPCAWRSEDGVPSLVQGTGTEFVSHRVKRISILNGRNAAVQSLHLKEIKMEAPIAVRPSWLGKKPPSSGEWKQTFVEEFEDDSLDRSKWNVATENHWDQRSHFSRDNVTIENGVAKLRFEHKTGRHNDSPDGKQTDYQTGFLDTYDKFSQRYGYFECRMKLPRSPGLWPAFWTMPDRGKADGPKWKRMQTSRGGMEFDIVEHLTRWGPHRYNIAFHWDGYGKNHQHFGNSSVYVNHDEEGFITAGLLWLPEQAVYFCNGKAVARWDSPRISDVPAILMFTHVSGGWDNDPLDHDQLPDDFVIDYVRVWQRNDLSN